MTEPVSSSTTGPLTGRRILVVDDSEIFRHSLSRLLVSRGAEVSAAENGKIALDLIGIENFSCVISDIHMPEMNGIEFTHRAKHLKPELPIILITGFAEINETKEAYQIGASGFLPKPFKTEDLFALLEQVLNPKSAQNSNGDKDKSEDLDAQFCGIPIDDFLCGKTIKYNIFIRLSSTNYILIAHQGNNLSTDQIRTYKDKFVKFLYLHKEDFKKYVNFNVALMQMVTGSDKLEKTKKVNFLQQTIRTVVQNYFSSVPDQETIQASSAVVETALSLLADNNDLLNFLSKIAEEKDPLHEHLTSVSIVSVMLARQSEWTSAVTLTKVGLAGILHDIGKREIPKAILDKSPMERTPEEVQLFETHPVRGYELLAKIHGIPQEILQAIHQHHENNQGTGYPLRLTRNMISPMSKLITVANTFCNILQSLSSPDSKGYSKEDLSKAATLVVQTNRDRMDSQFLRILSTTFGTPS